MSDHRSPVAEMQQGFGTEAGALRQRCGMRQDLLREDQAPSRKLKLGSQTVELRHAPPWQLLFPGQAAGEVIRSLAWAGPSRSEAALGKLTRKLPVSELLAVANARVRMPTWLASQVSKLVSRG